MTDARRTPEDPVTAHVREHHAGEPPAHLDAFILDAARRQAPAAEPGLWQRWLRICRQPRYQVAFASLVGVALMLSMVQQAPEPVPRYDFAPAAKPDAPAARKEAAESRSLAAPAAALSAPAPAPMAERAAPMESEAFSADSVDEAKASKRAAAPANGLDRQLREVLRLREAGQAQAADRLFNELHKRYPGTDLDARLTQLQEK